MQKYTDEYLAYLEDKRKKRKEELKKDTKLRHQNYYLKVTKPKRDMVKNFT